MKKAAQAITERGNSAKEDAEKVAAFLGISKNYIPDGLENDVNKAVRIGRELAKASLLDAVLYFQTLAAIVRQKGISEIPFYREMRLFASIEDGSVLSRGAVSNDDILEAIEIYKLRVCTSVSGCDDEKKWVERLGTTFEMLAERDLYQTMDLTLKFQEDIRPLRREVLSQTVMLWAIKQVGVFIISGVNEPFAIRQMHEIERRLFFVEPKTHHSGWKEHQDAKKVWSEVVSAWYKKDSEEAVEYLRHFINWGPDSPESLAMAKNLLNELTSPGRNTPGGRVIKAAQTTADTLKK